jgi:hypothetical protein
MAVSADEWLQGKNAWPVLMSMRTGVQSRTVNREQATDISNKNNGRKFMFLSEETNPDYRQVNQRQEVQSSSQVDHSTFGADKEQVRMVTQ